MGNLHGYNDQLVRGQNFLYLGDSTMDHLGSARMSPWREVVFREVQLRKRPELLIPEGPSTLMSWGDYAPPNGPSAYESKMYQYSIYFCYVDTCPTYQTTEHLGFCGKNTDYGLGYTLHFSVLRPVRKRTPHPWH